jgi:tRNA (adenine57-N1/adenine58-N1)-methyltransferase catalytic subunit
MQKGDHILLVGKRKIYWVFDGNNLNTEMGIIYARDVKKAKYGAVVKTHKDNSFTIARPTIHDFFTMKAIRGPQISHYKDLGAIVSYTGVSPGWRCLDAGSGTGFLSMFIANIVGKEGHVYSYEKKLQHHIIAKKNALLFGLKNITFKNIDAKKFTEENLDLITLDMEGSQKLVKKAFNALNPGGWLVIYSPVINQAADAALEMHKAGFAEIAMKEVLVRDWKTVEGFFRPEHHMLAHTAFLTFARKI